MAKAKPKMDPAMTGGSKAAPGKPDLKAADKPPPKAKGKGDGMAVATAKDKPKGKKSK